ncbi:MAG TPA: phospholipase D-like domain-containing protein [Gemmataceae bacterium]
MFSPFYSMEGLNVIDNSLRRSVALTFWTRLSLRDWASGVSDPEALLSLVRKLSNTQRSAQLFTNKKLHAKAYFADQDEGLVGSANLSKGGFQTNVELMVHLDGNDARAALDVLTVASSQRVELYTSDQLAEWVTRHSKLIKRARAKLKEGLQELELAEEAETGRAQPSLREPTDSTLDEFVEWLGNNLNLTGASQLLQRHIDKQRLRQQGHVKQCFAGAFRFFQEYPSWIQRLTHAAETADGLAELHGALLTDWSSHLQTHASAFNDLYSYSTLRKILPPNCGGLHRGGGGGGKTLKRILPLVARFISQQGQRPNNGV